MAQFRYNQGFVQRNGKSTGKGKGRTRGESPVAKAAYNAREDIKDERLGKTHYYARRKDNDLIHSEIIAPHRAPDWAKDRATLWNKVDDAENRKDSVTSMTVNLSLPRELSDQQNIDLMRDFVHKAYTSKGIIADVAFHKSEAKDGGNNPHAHIQLSTRKLEGDGFHDKKAETWRSKGQLFRWRKDWADVQNDHLEKHGVDARVDHRTLKEQGIDRIPQKHLGKEAVALERKGKKSRRGRDNQLIDNKNTVNETTRNLKPDQIYFKEIDQPTDPDMDESGRADTKLSRHLRMLQDTIRNTAFLSQEQQISRHGRFNAVIQKSIEKTVDSARAMRDKLLEKYTRFTGKEGEDKDHDFGR